MASLGKKIEIAISAAIKEELRPSRFRNIMEEARIIVRRRTLLGFGVPKDGASREKLKRLSDSYIEQRQGKVVFFKKNGKTLKVPTSAKFQSRINLSSKTTPKKSNLTLTGEMLDSLKAFIKGPGKGFIEPTGSREDGLTNKEVAAFVSKERAFLHLSKNEIRQLLNLVLDQLTTRVNKKLTRLK